MSRGPLFAFSLLTGSTLLGYLTYAGLAFAACLAGYLALQPGRALLKRTCVEKYREMFPQNGRWGLIRLGLFAAFGGLVFSLASLAFSSGAAAHADLGRSLIAAIGGQLVATAIVIAIAVLPRRVEKSL